MFNARSAVYRHTFTDARFIKGIGSSMLMTLNWGKTAAPILPAAISCSLVSDSSKFRKLVKYQNTRNIMDKV